MKLYGRDVPGGVAVARRSNGQAAFPCEQLRGTAVLRLEAIESGRVFLLRSNTVWYER